MKALSVNICGEMFLIDASLAEKVARAVSCTPIPTAPVDIVGIINMKGRVITILNLAELLGYDVGIDYDMISCVILKQFDAENNQLGVFIDKQGDLIDIDDRLIKSPPPIESSEDRKYILGVVNFGDQFYRVIHMEKLLDCYRRVDEHEVL